MTLGVVVLAKNPVPGQVKTRLQPQYSAGQAASLAEAALSDVWSWASAADWRGVAIDPMGEPLPGWLSGEVFPQSDGNLGQRITAALAEARRRCPEPLLLVGMDTPQLGPEHLLEAEAGLAEHDYVLGPAVDGGFWALGAAGPPPRGLAGVPMSRADTGTETLRLLRAQGQVGLLVDLEDVDDAASASRVADLAPRSAFAATLAGINPLA